MISYIRCNGITRFGVQCMRHHWTYSAEFNCGVHRTNRRYVEPTREVETLKSTIQQRDSELARERAMKCKLADDLKISECVIEQQKQQIDSEINRRMASDTQIEVLQETIAKHDETMRSMKTQFDEKIGQSKHFITKLIEQNKKQEQEIAQLKMESIKARFARTLVTE